MKCSEYISTPIVKTKCEQLHPDSFAAKIERLLEKLPSGLRRELEALLEKRRVYDIVESVRIGDFVLVETCLYTYAVKKPISIQLLSRFSQYLTPDEVAVLLRLTELSEDISKHDLLAIVDNSEYTISLCRKRAEDLICITEDNVVIDRDREYMYRLAYEKYGSSVYFTDIYVYKIEKSVNLNRYALLFCKLERNITVQRHVDFRKFKERVLLGAKPDDIIVEKKIPYKIYVLRGGKWVEEISYATEYDVKL